MVGASPESTRHEPREFSGQRAQALAELMVNHGPRVPGSTAHGRAAAWLRNQIRARGARLTEQPFTTSLDGREVACVNLVGHTGPEGPAAVVLVAHWDTRPWSDRDRRKERRGLPGPGANDGASGVSVLLEMLPLLPRDLAVATVFVDAEDLGRVPEDYAQGSRAWVRTLGVPGPRWVLVLDMVGRADVRFRPEAASLRVAPWLVERLWRAAGTVGAAPWFSRMPGPELIDDHVPFIEAGIPAVDLVDMADPAWHTHDDVPERLDAGTLGAVGRSVLALVNEEEPRTARRSPPRALSVGYDEGTALSRERSLP